MNTSAAFSRGFAAEVLQGAHFLKQNFPNPFNISTEISYALTGQAEISLTIYDIAGREIVTLASGFHYPGHYTQEWNGEDNNGQIAPSGIYYCRLITGISVQTKKMILIR